MDKVNSVAEAAKTAKDAIPIVSQAPLAAALIVVAFFAFLVVGLAAFVIWTQRAHLKQISKSLDRQVTANEAQAKTLEGQSVKLGDVSRMRELLATIANFLHTRGMKLIPSADKGEM